MYSDRAKLGKGGFMIVPDYIKNTLEFLRHKDFRFFKRQPNKLNEDKFLTRVRLNINFNTLLTGDPTNY